MFYFDAFSSREPVPVRSENAPWNKGTARKVFSVMRSRLIAVPGKRRRHICELCRRYRIQSIGLVQLGCDNNNNTADFSRGPPWKR
jgi:hypothetical protein